jgi:hypothetical protein
MRTYIREAAAAEDHCQPFGEKYVSRFLFALHTTDVLHRLSTIEQDQNMQILGQKKEQNQ